MRQINFFGIRMSPVTIGVICIAMWMVLSNNSLIFNTDATEEPAVTQSHAECPYNDVTIKVLHSGFYGLGHTNPEWVPANQSFVVNPHSEVYVFDQKGEDILQTIQVICEQTKFITNKHLFTEDMTIQETIMTTNVLEETGVFDMGDLLN